MSEIIKDKENEAELSKEELEEYYYKDDPELRDILGPILGK